MKNPFRRETPVHPLDLPGDAGDPSSTDPIDTLSTSLARTTSRRGFMAGAVRLAVGIGIGLTYLTTGRAFAAVDKIGCAALDAGDKDAGVKVAGCTSPGGGYTAKDNCHWKGGMLPGGGTSPSSDQYGCRPLNGAYDYCENLKPAKTCGDPGGDKLPTCPTGLKNAGYWRCCCDGKNTGDKGPDMTICLDCNDGGDPPTTKCTCKKVVKGADACKGA